MKKIIVLISVLLALSSTAVFAAEGAFPGWSFTSDGKNAEVSLVYEDDFVNDGETAMCIKPDTEEGVFTISQQVDVVEGKKYTFSVNYRGSGIKDAKISIGGTSSNFPNGKFARYRTNKAEWTATGSSATVSVVISGNTEELYIDNLSLYAEGEDVNLLENYSFEEGADRIAPAEVKNPEVTPGVNKLTLRWQDPEDADFDSVIVTGIGADTEPDGYTATVKKGEQKLEITGLEGWREYSFLIQTKDNTLGNISTGVTVKGTTEGITYIAGEYDFTVDKKVSVSVENIQEENFSAELVVLVYDSEDKLVNVTSSGVYKIDKNKTAQPTAEYEIPTGGYANIFLWDGIFSMRSLKDSVTIPQ